MTVSGENPKRSAYPWYSGVGRFVPVSRISRVYATAQNRHPVTGVAAGSGAGGPEQALRESLTILEQLGAGPLAAIVRQRLREGGARGIPRGPRASTRRNPAGLTSREIQVLRLLWKGGSNKAIARDLFLTENTIETHLRRIYEKLGTRNRTQAAAIAREAGAI